MTATALRRGRRTAADRGAALCAIATLGLFGCVRDPDVNRDGVVDERDVELVTSCVGLAPEGVCVDADTDHDGHVDANDVDYVTTHAAPVFPTLVASEPAAGAAGVPRTAWLRLDFASTFRARATETLSLTCDGVAQRFTPDRVSSRRLVVDPSPDLPAGASCTLAWLGAGGTTSLAFTTAAAGPAETVYYDRTDPSSPPPFPDDYWLVPDATTETGQRVAIGVPDRESDVVQLFTSLIHDTQVLDGFSPLAMIVAELSAAPDPASLPMTVDASVDPLASVVLLDLTPNSDTYGVRVPFQLYVRNDTVGDQAETHALVAFPSVPLTPGGRYGFVVTRRALADASRPFDPSDFQRAALGPAQPGEDPAVAAVRAVDRDVVDGLAVAMPPVPAEDVALALRISVRSTSHLPNDVLAMKQQVAAAPAPTVTVTSVSPSSSLVGATTVHGTWQAPNWRQGAFLARDANGAPRIVKRTAVPFVLVLPAAAATGPVPVVMYQHGNPGSADEIELAAGHLVGAGFAVAGFTDPINRAYVDLSAQYTGIFGTLLFGGKIPDLWVETYGEQLAFLRALETLAARDWLPRSAPDGIRELDLSRPIGYLGVSNGGSHGQAFLAYAPEIEAAALVAGSPRYAELLFHQDETQPTEVGSLLSFIATQVPDVRAPDVWAGLSMFQMDFDAQDPQNHAAFLHAHPLEVSGTTRKASLLVVEGIADSFNPANAIRSLAWTAGPLPQLGPVEELVPYLEQRTGTVQGNLGDGATGALVQYACPGDEGHFCAQEGSESQQVAFFRSALTGGAPVVTASDLDSDGDGLTDVYEGVRGTDPYRADTDGDGLSDKSELDAGLDPKNPADAGADRDGDGLSNADEIAHGTNLNVPDTDYDGLLDGAEVALGTNPLRPDTDGGGRKDGQEVNVDHTDPLDRGDDIPIALLPMDFYDGEGFDWLVDAYGGIQSRLLFSSSLLSAAVGSSSFGSGSTAPTEDGGRELRLGPTTSGTLRLSRKIYVPIDAGFLRVLDRVENVGPDPVAAPLGVWNDLGYEARAIVATSSGDLSADVGDDFVVHDSYWWPPLALVFSGPGAALDPSSVTANASSLSVQFPLVVPPHRAVAILTFALHRADVAGATDAARQLVAQGGGALSGLSSAERREIVNFAVAPDADHDGLLDFDELALGTDPSNPDTDGDGLLDGFEVDHEFDPLVAGDEQLDPDADGADNLAEQQADTDPRNPDCDGDGLLDGFELAIGTDPWRADTDGDGASDGREVQAGTDPLDATADSDGDTLRDADELLGGTDPFDADTDGDGIRDDVEYDWGLDPTDPTDAQRDWDGDGLGIGTELALGTDPNAFDTDRDEVGDGAEISAGTNPLVADTDGGGRTDGAELRDGTDPLDPGDDLHPVTPPFTLTDGGGFPWTIGFQDFEGDGGVLRSDVAWDFVFAVAYDWALTRDGRGVLVYGDPYFTHAERRIFVSPDHAFVRILDVLHEDGDTSRSHWLFLDHWVNTAQPASVVWTSSGDAVPEMDDDAFVLDDGAGSPVVTVVASGPGAAIQPDCVGWSQNPFTVCFQSVVAPPHGEAIVMSFLALTSSRDDAIAAATSLTQLPPEALVGLTADERAAIVNFAVPPAP